MARVVKRAYPPGALDPPYWAAARKFFAERRPDSAAVRDAGSTPVEGGQGSYNGRGTDRSDHERSKRRGSDHWMVACRRHVNPLLIFSPPYV